MLEGISADSGDEFHPFSLFWLKWSTPPFYSSQSSLLPGLGQNAVVKNDKRWLEAPAGVPLKSKSASAGGSHRKWVLNKVWTERMKM